MTAAKGKAAIVKHSQSGSRWLLVLFSMVWAATPTLAADVEVDRAIENLEALKKTIRADYPTVEHQTINAYQMADERRLIVDVRSAEEFTLSHLPGAQHIEDRQTLLQLAKANPSQQLVLYCSVGVRSSIAAQWLQEQGISNVVNLEGSIFEWYNRDLPLVNEFGATEEIHGFNRYWASRYLKDRRQTDK